MPRIVLGVEYLGGRYCGWQKQNSCDGVQARLEKALAVIACEPIEVFCAGRTDRGVHAMGQVVHFDTIVQRPEEAWVRGANSHLPDDIRVLWREETDEAFHARFSAVARRYRYVIANRRVRAGVFHGHHAWVPIPLDHEAMHEAAQVLLGEHDFTSFRAAECQAKHPIRRVTEVQVSRVKDLVLVDIEANAFLHHMVRNIVGSLLMIGRGERPTTWIAELLQAKDRKLAAPTAPAAGLYLTHVRYPEAYDFPTLDLSYLWRGAA
jgi:tRNA pseudouridine38-40 synthase